MNLGEIKRHIVNYNDDKKTEIIIELISYMNTIESRSIKSFIKLNISFILCHYNSETKFSGIKLFRKIIMDNYFLFKGNELNDLLSLNDYYYELFNEGEAKKDLDYIKLLLLKSSYLQLPLPNQESTLKVIAK